jgi:ribosome-associated translation inhibitor RaiA
MQSDALDTLIAHEAAKLERYFPRVVHCRVLVERLYRRSGAGVPYHLRILLSVPGHEIVVNQTASVHESPVAAARTAFKKAKRELQDYARLIAS